jgi:hypothetical protein
MSDMSGTNVMLVTPTGATGGRGVRVHDILGVSTGIDPPDGIAQLRLVLYRRRF